MKKKKHFITFIATKCPFFTFRNEVTKEEKPLMGCAYIILHLRVYVYMYVYNKYVYIFRCINI